MNSRKSTSAFATGLAASGLAGALTAPLAGAATVASDSQSYTPGGDFVTYCSGSTGVGGGCFAPAATATTVQASLKDAVTANPAGAIMFRDAAGKALAAPVPFCGASGQVAIPAGTANIFVYAEEQVVGTSCGVATTGTVTLTQSNPL